MKKKLVKTGIIATMLLVASGATYAASNFEKIQANLNHAITFKLKGSSWTPVDSKGKKLAPITYNNTTYLPLRSVAEATGMDVVWNQEKQLVELKEKVVREVQEKFSEKNVKMTAGYTAGITRDEEVLLVGGVQYDAAYIVKGVNSAGYSVTLEFPKGVKELKLTLGYKDTKKDGGAEYSIRTTDKQTYAIGDIANDSTKSDITVVANGETKFTFNFKAEAGSDGTGYILWDDSYIIYEK